MTDSCGVVAVISSYEPDAGLVATVDSVIGQVDRVVIVDDGSPSLIGDPAGTVRAVLDRCAEVGATVLESGDNRGIASALNRGVTNALDGGADLILTLDQDTVLDVDYVQRMVAHRELAASVGITDMMLAPSEINGEVAPFWFAHRGLTLAFEPLQSGMLFSRRLFELIGLFEEGLFIDCVETEFYLRARARGVHALIVPGTCIHHRLGHPATWTVPRPLRWALGRRGSGATVEFTEDAPFRHYYIARNRLVLYRRYARTEPLWCAVSIAKDTLSRGRAMLIGSHRVSRIYLTASGFRAGIKGDTGRIPARTLARSRGRGVSHPSEERRARHARRRPRAVSVVIPARNARNLIDRQLEALATQDYPAGFEVLICDNGSRDGLRRHIETHRLREKLQMKWLDASERAGTSFARNVGSRAAAGDLIVYCDADDMVHPQWLRHMVETAGFHNVVSGGVETTSLNAPEVASWRPMPDAEEPFEFPGFMNVVSGCNMACWRDDFMAVGGFDETYVSGYEDADFALRVQLRGGTVGHAPEALVGYRLRETLRGTFSQSAQYGLGNVQLYADYRDYGMPRRPVIALLDVLLYLTLRNPLLPEVVTRVPAGRWLFQAGHLLGRIKGSVRYGCFYV